MLIVSVNRVGQILPFLTPVTFLRLFVIQRGRWCFLIKTVKEKISEHKYFWGFNAYMYDCLFHVSAIMQHLNFFLTSLLLKVLIAPISSFIATEVELATLVVRIKI